ncbi:unnamed protein product, partial [Notodromas monacha]
EEAEDQQKLRPSSSTSTSSSTTTGSSCRARADTDPCLGSCGGGGGGSGGGGGGGGSDDGLDCENKCPSLVGTCESGLGSEDASSCCDSSTLTSSPASSVAGCAVNKRTVAALASKFNSLIQQQQACKTTTSTCSPISGAQESVELRLLRSRAGVAQKIQSLRGSPGSNNALASLQPSRSRSISDLLDASPRDDVDDDDACPVGGSMGLFMSKRQSLSNPDLLDDAGAVASAAAIAAAAAASHSATVPPIIMTNHCDLKSSTSPNRFWDSKIYGNVRGIVRSAMKTFERGDTSGGGGASDASVYASDVSLPASDDVGETYECPKQFVDVVDESVSPMRRDVVVVDSEYQVPRGVRAERVVMTDENAGKQRTTTTTKECVSEPATKPNSSFLWNSLQKNCYEIPVSRRFSLAGKVRNAKSTESTVRNAPPVVPKASSTTNTTATTSRQSIVSKIGQQSSSLWRNLNSNKFSRSKKPDTSFYSCTDVSTIMERELGHHVQTLSNNDDKYYQKIDTESKKYLELISSASSSSSAKYEAILGTSYEDTGEYDNLVGLSEQYLKLSGPGSEQYLRLEDGRYEKIHRDSTAFGSETYDDVDALPGSPFSGMPEMSIAESLRSELMECINPLFQDRFSEFHRNDGGVKQSEGVVVARLAVVRDQDESLNYVYDNENIIGNKGHQRCASQNYETIDEERPVFGTEPIIVHRPDDVESGDDCCDVHVVTSYELTPAMRNEPKLPPRRKLPEPTSTTPMDAKCPPKRSLVDKLPKTPRASQGDEWIDVERSEDEEEEASPSVVLTRFRMRTRSGRIKGSGSNKRSSSKKNVRRSWSKSLRDFQQAAVLKEQSKLIKPQKTFGK